MAMVERGRCHIDSVHRIKQKREAIGVSWVRGKRLAAEVRKTDFAWRRTRCAPVLG
jgi:hypothetical protein